MTKLLKHKYSILVCTLLIVFIGSITFFNFRFAFQSNLVTFIINDVLHGDQFLGDNYYVVDYTITSTSVFTLDISLSSNEGFAPEFHGEILPGTSIIGRVGFGQRVDDCHSTEKFQPEEWLLIEKNQEYAIKIGESLELWKTAGKNGEIAITTLHVQSNR